LGHSVHVLRALNDLL